MPELILCHIYYRTPTGVIDHETCTDNFLYRPKYLTQHTDAL